MIEKIPDSIAQVLTQILLSDDKAKLLLQGFVSGKGFEGNVKITGAFTIEQSN